MSEATRDMTLAALHDAPVYASKPSKRPAPLEIKHRASGETALRIYFNDGAEVLRSTTNGVYVCIGRECREAYHTCQHVLLAKESEDARTRLGATD